LNPGFEGRGLVDILALFRHRRAPQPRRRAGNGGWQDIGLTSLGGPMALARGKKVAPAATRPRPRPQAPAARQPAARQEAMTPAARQEAMRSYLAAHNLEKTYGGRRVVNGVSLYVGAARRSVCWGRTAPARPRRST